MGKGIPDAIGRVGGRKLWTRGSGDGNVSFSLSRQSVEKIAEEPVGLNLTTAIMSKKTKSDKKTARRATSNVFAMFEQNQIMEFKEAFQLIDSNKDGLIDKNDLRATFDSLGKVVNETDLSNMIAEAPGPINFTMFLTIFGERISGTDQEEVIKKAFKTFDPDGAGKISEKKLKKALMTWGEKLSSSEVDEAFKEAPIDRDGMIDIGTYVKVICGTAVDEE